MNTACHMLSRGSRQRVQRSEVPVRMCLAQLMVLKDERRVTYVGDVPHVLVDAVLHPVRIVLGRA